MLRAICGHHQRFGARRQIRVRRINQNISQHRPDNSSARLARHHRIESRRQTFYVRALAAPLEAFKRDVFSQTHTATLEGGCYSAVLSTALAVFAVFFLDFTAAFLPGLATALAAGFLLGGFAAFFAPRFAGFLPPLDAV